MDNGASSYRRFLEGDNDAFTEIVELYKENLIFFINRYVHDLDSAEDISEDVFVELLVHKHRYNFKTSFKTYLFSIARHKAIDHVRKLSRHGETSYDDEFGDAQTPDEKDLEDEFIASERERQLHKAIDKLNSDYREVLHLLYFENMTTEEAGRVLRKNRKQIENLSYRAKGMLKKILEKEDFCYEEQ